MLAQQTIQHQCIRNVVVLPFRCTSLDIAASPLRGSRFATPLPLVDVIAFSQPVAVPWREHRDEGSEGREGCRPIEEDRDEEASNEVQAHHLEFLE